MEIVGPVLGIVSVIGAIVAGIVVVKVVPAKIAQGLKSAPERLAQEEIQNRLGELDQLHQRINELEERVDFAERLLAQRHESERLGP